MAEEPRVSRIVALRGAVLRLRDGLFRSSLLTGALLALVLAVLLWPGLGLRSTIYEVGEIAGTTVRVLGDFTYEDFAATEERRRQALELVPDVYDFDPQVRETVRSRIARTFEFGRASIESGTTGEPAFAESVARELAVELDQAHLDLLLDLGFSEDVEQDLTDAVVSVLARDILARKSALAALGRPVQRRDPELERVEVLPDLADVLSMEDAARAVQLQILALSERSRAERSTLADVAGLLIVPTLTRNEVVTTRLRAAAEEEVDPVVIQMRRGRTIVRAGDEVTERDFRRMEAMRVLAPAASPWAGVGSLLFAALLVGVLHRLYQPARPGRRWMAHGFAMAGTLIVMHLAITRVLGFLWRAVVAQAGGPVFSDSSIYIWAVPYASVALLMVILENRASATLTMGVFAALVTLMTGSLAVGPFALISGLIALLVHSRMERRTEVLRLGSLVGIGGALLVLGIELVRAESGPMQLAIESASAFAGGLLTGPLLILALPVLETVFERTSDLRLMELARRDNPILRRLALYAPGTYQHSVLVGILSESAASAIGANAILCSTAALYHDIGKLRRAEYFVENVRGENPHRHLPPRESAIIIRKHVEEGVRDAERLGLPKDIVDVIPQHHGTRPIRVFLEKAREAAARTGETVNEDDFRYPGPKPQTREAAIVMMADSIEAAARSVTKPSRAELERVIDRILDTLADDDQLDECDLKLRDMVRIRESFLATLEGIHHQRISYPGFDFRGTGGA